QGALMLTRVAVGDHILLGGDNMDLKLAHTVAAGLAARGTRLDFGQMLMLWHSSRFAKERLFSDPTLTSAPVTVVGRGSKVIAGTIKADLTRAEVEQELVEGFFPHCPHDAEPTRARFGGMQELGLPYAHDPAVSKHLARFLHRQVGAVTQQTGGSARPTAVLFNGGVFKAAPLQQRVVDILNSWHAGVGPAVRVLPSADLDQA